MKGVESYDERWAELEKQESAFRTLIDDRELALLEGKKEILDLGCGDGATLALLTKKGHTVTGIDYSKVGIEKTKERLAKEGLQATVLQGDVYEPLPFNDESFDAVIAYQVINHNTLDKIRDLLKELYRVLKPNGLFSVKVADSSTYAFTYHDGLYYDEYGSIFKLVAERTFIPVAGWEKGVIHYEFNKDLLREEVTKAGFTFNDERTIICHVLANFHKK